MKESKKVAKARGRKTGQTQPSDGEFALRLIAELEGILTSPQPSVAVKQTIRRMLRPTISSIEKLLAKRPEEFSRTRQTISPGGAGPLSGHSPEPLIDHY